MFRALVIAALLLAAPTLARPGADSNYNIAIAAIYTGPGDIVSSATAWYGLRAYSSSQIGGTTKAVSLRRASDNTTCDFDINTSGNLGGTDSGCSLGAALSLATFATQDATATCTIATTTATCTGASSTPHVGSTISGAGLTKPCYASAVGSFAGGAGTVTVAGVGSSPCGTISVGETLTFTYGLFVTEWYDQTGNGHHIVQATAGAQPYLFPTCLGVFPCLQVATNTFFLLGSGNITPATGTVSLSGVALRSGTLRAGQIISENSGNSVTLGNAMRLTNVSNTWQLAGGTSGTLAGTASDAAWHAANGVIATSSSVLNIDGTETTGTVNGNTSAAAPAALNAGNSLQMQQEVEAGIWDNLSFTSGNRSSICHNQFTYWGTATSC